MYYFSNFIRALQVHDILISKIVIFKSFIQNKKNKKKISKHLRNLWFDQLFVIV